MILLKTIRNRHFSALLKLHCTSKCLNNTLSTSTSSNSSQFLYYSSFSRRSFSISARFAKNAEEKIEKFTLSGFFKKALWADEGNKNRDVNAEANSENVKLKEEGNKNSDVNAEANSENGKLKEELRNSEEEVRSLKEKLRNLEEEVRILNKERREKEKRLKLSTKKVDLIGGKGKKGSLSSLFVDKKNGQAKLVERTEFGNEDPMVYKELSTDMQMFTQHLYKQGYFKDANFIPKGKFDLKYFEVSYAREFLKFAAVSFGKDHQEIAKWLSAKDLKEVALFGCPSLGQRSVYAAKHMRGFFEIDEHKVCQKCILNKSCKHANKRSKKASAKLNLASVTQVLTMYAMESVPQKLVVPEEIKNSVSRLLKEIVTLTQNTS